MALKFISLKYKQAIPPLLLLITLCSYFYFIWKPQAITNSRVEITKALQHTLEIVEDQITADLTKNDLGAVNERLDIILLKNPSWLALVLTDNHQKIIYPNANHVFTPVNHLSKNIISIKQPISAYGDQIATITLTYDFKDTKILIEDQIKLQLIATTALCFVLSLLIYFYTLFKIIFPINQLKDSAKKISQIDAQTNNLDLNLPSTQSDEIGQLVLYFKEMSDALFQNQQDMLEKNIKLAAQNDLIELEVKKKTQELQNANEELEEFAYRTSHDLRSPLISAKTLVELTNSYIEQQDYQKATEALTLSEKSLESLETLVSDLLLLTQTKSMDEKEQPIDLKSLIETSIEKLKFMEGFNNVEISLAIDFIKTVSLKKSRIQLIVENLISNAIKYQDPNESKSFIEISLREESGSLILCVEDNGLGIPKENQKSLFQMFKRFHTGTSFGSGLGLYMIKKSAAILQSSIAFEDTGKGSKFILRIPL